MFSRIALPSDINGGRDMTRIFLAALLAVAMGSAALAQPNSSTTETGTPGKPPAGAPVPPQSTRHDANSAIGANVPTLPQVALHPTATIGSPVPLAGPGGTTKNATGN
jgi:hypothetical protein